MAAGSPGSPVIKWCSYCQHFIEEVEPFEDFTLTHGVCAECAPRVADFSLAERTAAHEFRLFFSALHRTAVHGSRIEASHLLEESQRLGIRPMDLMMGLLQPLLREIGRLWARGEITVATEHRFTALATDLVAHFRAALPAPAQGQPELALFTAEGNYHTLGLQMAEAHCAAIGLPALIVVPGLPTGEVLDLLRRHRPQVVGFSVAMPEQMAQVRAVAEALEHLPPLRLPIQVGGPAVRLGLELSPDPRIQLCHDFRTLSAS